MTSVISCPYCHTSVIVPEELRQVAETMPWSTLLFDNFTSNDNNWAIGDRNTDHFTKLSRNITEGRYRWQAVANTTSSIATIWLKDYQLTDFHLLVNSKHIGGSRAGSCCGVVFRLQDEHNYYWFHITDSQFFRVSLKKDRQWLHVVDRTRTNAIKPNGVNQVEVVARGSHFLFLINGQLACEVEDNRLSQGAPGLAVEGYRPGEEIVYDFMDITLRAPG